MEELFKAFFWIETAKNTDAMITKIQLSLIQIF